MKLLKICIVIASIFAYTILPMRLAYAADVLDPVCSGTGADSTACKSRTDKDPIIGQGGILVKVLQIIIFITAAVSVIVIMIGGFKYITSTGDPSKTKSAKDTILYAVIGLVVAISAQAIVSFVLSRL